MAYSSPCAGAAKTSEVEPGTSRQLRPTHSVVLEPPAKASRQAEAGDLNADAKLRMEQNGSPPWALIMMDSISSRLDNVGTRVDEAVATAQEAKDEARQASVAVTALAHDLDKLKVDLASGQTEGIHRAVEKVLETKWPTFSTQVSDGSSGGKGKGKGKGKSEERMEKRDRSVIVRNFPKDTQGTVIKASISEILSGVKEDIEEVYAFGPTDDAGSARFKSPASMWKYLSANRGNHSHDVLGTTVHVRASASKPLDGEDADREWAVKKIVRVLIEANGGDGKKIKPNIKTDYRKGRVWYNIGDDNWQKVAEWQDGRMGLAGCMTQHKQAYDAYVDQKMAEY